MASRFTREYLRTKQVLHKLYINRNDILNHKWPLTFPRSLMNFGAQTAEIYWHSPTVTVIASMFTRRSPIASQPNFSTLSEVNQIWECTYRIQMLLPPPKKNVQTKNCLFSGGFYDDIATWAKISLQRNIDKRKKIFKLRRVPYIPLKFVELWSTNG